MILTKMLLIRTLLIMLILLIKNITKLNFLKFLQMQIKKTHNLNILKSLFKSNNYRIDLLSKNSIIDFIFK